jgi:hypothetical protein
MTVKRLRSGHLGVNITRNQPSGIDGSAGMDRLPGNISGNRPNAVNILVFPPQAVFSAPDYRKTVHMIYPEFCREGQDVPVTLFVRQKFFLDFSGDQKISR